MNTAAAAALEVAREAARDAGALIREAWHAGRDEVGTKSSGIDLVTETDRAAEERIVARLLDAFPRDRIVAEEGGLRGFSKKRVWYVDPVDGTTNFAHGFPHFAVTLAFELEGEIVVGVTYDVPRDELYEAVRGEGARVNGVPLRVSEASALASSLVATGFPYDRQTTDDDNTAESKAFIKSCRGVRRAGAASLDLAYLARGWLDGYWEMRLNPWDVAAGALLVTEAGGKTSDYEGGPFDPHGGHYVASNGRIHDEMVELLKGVRGRG